MRVKGSEKIMHEQILYSDPGAVQESEVCYVGGAIRGEYYEEG